MIIENVLQKKKINYKIVKTVFPSIVIFYQLSNLLLGSYILNNNH